jgi:WS/DGAT/MGAT family acyltransferase
VEPPESAALPARLPSTVDLLRRGLTSVALNPLEVARTVPRSLGYLDQLPGAANFPGAGLLSDAAGLVGRAFGGGGPVHHRSVRAPRAPFNGPITAHRRVAFGSVDLATVKRVKNRHDMTVNDVVMTLTATALRRWLLDHDALPGTPLVAAVPVSVRATDGRWRAGDLGNHVSVMTAELPTHLADPRERLVFMRASMREAKQHFDAVPATILQDLAHVIPTALSGLAARGLFHLATLPGVLFNLFVSNVPGPQVPLYIAGARVEGLFPVSAVTDYTGGLNITLFSYDGELDFGLVACREMMPDLWHLIGYLEEALEELDRLTGA